MLTFIIWVVGLWLAAELLIFAVQLVEAVVTKIVDARNERLWRRTN